ncbi:AraC family transcriptional regulator [Xylophilus sp. ASV27]|uniref:AraC family transcriptional regulator n=1 Tax=Xylophilus sp. ASV27 TaxID=2795129 RepID=UPI0018EC7498|nr:AraC family transcriptional regulator [Xylophilus sp. ASV27]
MSLWDFARDPAGALTMLQFGAEHGVPEQVLLRGSRLTRAQLDDPNTELSAAQELRVIDNLMGALRRPPGLGLEVGLRCHFSTFGLWGYGLIASATLGDAVDMALRYIQLTSAYSVIEKVVRGDHALLNFSPPELSPTLQRFVVEREMGTAAALLQDIGGPGFRLSAFCLQAGKGRLHTIPERLRALGGLGTATAGEGYHVAFPARALASRPLTANPTTAAMCEQACRRLLERRRAGLQVGELVKEYLAVSTSPAIPTLGAISRLTNTSTRTLKRHLQREGRSFRALVADGRSALAAELVQDGTQSLADIAARLGYSSPSCFSQAFKRWHGVSPSEYRRGGAR